MRDLLNFFVRYSSWMLFAVYVIFSCILLFSRNPYQHYVYLTSANAVSSGLYRVTTGLYSYMYLYDVNKDLQKRNSELEMEVLNLKRQMARYRELIYADTMTVDSVLSRYRFIVAHVINNSVNHPHNYLTIEKGTLDGVHPEMGVVDQNGVVGIVNVAGRHSARVISLLNPYLRLSCKVKGQQLVGSLVWDGKSPSEAVLEELPRHAVFELGDTIVTSGYSTVFPEGIPVGIVVEKMADKDENFRSLRVRLNTDFTTLSTVRVIEDNMRDELNELELSDAGISAAAVKKKKVE